MSSSTEERIPVGRVGRPHGVKGEATIEVMSDYPDRFVPGARFQTAGGSPRHLEIEGVRRHQDVLLAKFRGVDDRTTAASLRGTTLTIAASERRELGEGEYWPEQLEGLAAIAPNRERLGIVTAVILGEAQDRLVVTTPRGEEVEVPLVSGIVGEVHPSGGYLIVDPPAGLF